MNVKPFFIHGIAMLLRFLVMIRLNPFYFCPCSSHKTVWSEKGCAFGNSVVTGIGIDSENNICMTDFNGYSTRIIQKLTSNGTCILGFRILIVGPQYFTHSSEIAIDSKDNVFVVDF